MLSTFFKSPFDGFADGFLAKFCQCTVASILFSASPPVLNLTLIEKPSRSVVDKYLSNDGLVTSVFFSLLFSRYFQIIDFTVNFNQRMIVRYPAVTINCDCCRTDVLMDKCTFSLGISLYIIN